jgi:DNA polymerase III subunit alpha
MQQTVIAPTISHAQIEIPQADNAPSFVHLRCHSEYSIIDGIVRLDDYIQAANQDGMPAVALTDLNNFFGAIKFYKTARDKGVKPILGCDLWLENSQDRDQPFRLLLLVQSTQGYRTLCALLSRAYLENQYRGRAEIQSHWLENTEGLILLSGGVQSDIGLALQNNQLSNAKTLTKNWA